MNRRHIGLLIVGVVTVASAVMVVPLLGNHLVQGDTDEISVSVEETRVTEVDDTTVVVAVLAIHNPTRQPLVVPERAAYSELAVTGNGTMFNNRRVTEIERGQVPAGGNGTATFRFTVKDKHADRIGDELPSTTLSGQVPFVLDGKTIKVEIEVPMAGGDA
jgi:hypothetical protein